MLTYPVVQAWPTHGSHVHIEFCVCVFFVICVFNIYVEFNIFIPRKCAFDVNFRMIASVYIHFVSKRHTQNVFGVDQHKTRSAWREGKPYCWVNNWCQVCSENGREKMLSKTKIWRWTQDVFNSVRVFNFFVERYGKPFCLMPGVISAFSRLQIFSVTSAHSMHILTLMGPWRAHVHLQ